MATTLAGSFETRPAFSIGKLVYSWGDVIEAARRRGEWAQLELHVRRTLGGVGEIPRDEVTAAARAFRLERRLIARDDLERWLEHWGLTAAEWLDSIRRSLAEEVEVPQPDEQAVVDATVVDAICSGRLERSARRLAAEAALAAEAGFLVKDLDGIAAHADRRRSEAGTADAVERELRTNALHWTRVVWQQLNLPDVDTAKEAALCIRIDGQTVAELADAIGTVPTRGVALLEDVEPSLRPYLEAASPDELIGPIPCEDGFALLFVDERRTPDPDDGELRARAGAIVARRAEQRALQAWVEWSDVALR